MSKSIKNILILGILFLIYSCNPDPVDLTELYPIIYNTHNVEDIVSLYSDDAIFEVPGQFTLKGKKAIRSITKYDSVLNIKMSVKNIISNGDTAHFDLTETNDWLKLSGIGKANYSVRIIFRGGLIANLQAKAKEKTASAFRNVLNPFIAWVNENNPKVLEELMPNGRFIYSAVNANKNLKLLKDWRESLK